jgi:class 3 adenylate cyclase
MDTNNRKMILVVDDERIITNPLKRLINRALRERKQTKQYELLTANDPTAALSDLDQRKGSRIDLALVVSDIMMPQMNGLDFLAEVRQLYPVAPRIILTGYGDKENAIRALNELNLYHYVEKPWDDDDFRSLVINALEKYRLETMFHKYVPNEVIKQFIDQDDEAILQGQILEATILFLDIVDFTKKAERMDAPTTVGLLNEYFTVMVEVIHKRNGILDKFTGDGLMALFGAPAPTGKTPADDAQNAILAALEIVERVAELNARLEKESETSKIEPIRIRIGLNTGEVVAGNIGSRSRVNYTAVGDAVNTASRIENAARNFIDGDLGCILISEYTHKQIKDSLRKEVDFEQLEPVQLKGKEKAMTLYKVIC